VPKVDGIRAGCFQFEVIPGDTDRNLARVKNALPEFADRGCRLLVLPEMWSCAFAYPLLSRMAKRTDAILQELGEWANRYGIVIVGSLPEDEDSIIFNTSYVIDASGEIVGKYRKIHLFSLHKENHHFGRGRLPLVCDTSVGRLGIMICYDLRFPELARRLALDGAEVLCVSALWPITRIEHWSLLMRCRAIENQLFVVGCNGCGIEGELQYGGASVIVSPTGEVLAPADNREGRITAELNPGDMTAFRKHIPCFSDRFPDAYGDA
jgi:predicted amidohydrolase